MSDWQRLYARATNRIERVLAEMLNGASDGDAIVYDSGTDQWAPGAVAGGGGSGAFSGLIASLSANTNLGPGAGLWDLDRIPFDTVIAGDGDTLDEDGMFVAPADGVYLTIVNFSIKAVNPTLAAQAYISAVVENEDHYAYANQTVEVGAGLGFVLYRQVVAHVLAQEGDHIKGEIQTAGITADNVFIFGAAEDSDTWMSVEYRGTV